MQYHVDGEIVAREEATVSVEDRGFRYGDAAFETLRAYGGTVFAWDRHLRRLERTCETLGMHDAVPDDLRDRIAATLDANGLADAYVRVSVTRGVQPGKLTPAPALDPTVVVVVDALPRGGVYGERVWDDPAVVQTAKTRRVPDAAVPADAKTHSYLNGVLARLELRRSATGENAAGEDGSEENAGAEDATGEDASRGDAGGGDAADEALLRDLDGNVAEGATSNVFVVDDGALKTPAAGDLLPGITREIVLELAADEPFPVETGSYGLDDVRDADEAFLTNTTWEVRPVGTVDGLAVGGGPVTALLQRLYDERVEATCYG